MKDKKKMYQPSHNWSIDKGDYKRDEDSTWTYFKKKRRKKNIRLFFLIVIYSLAVAGISYFIITMV